MQTTPNPPVNFLKNGPIPNPTHRFLHFWLFFRGPECMLAPEHYFTSSILRVIEKSLDLSLAK